ncbi:MAG: hypothetical protein FOGNACKC_05155 [Anaerolineae bacterium]|nr:hypothetical protein [Anaerolineae bacterium]
MFDSTGTTYLNLSAMTNGSGIANFNLPAGDYQFASDDVNNVRYFSGLPACSVPTCSTATITEPAFGSVAVTVTDANGPVANQLVYAFDGSGTTYLNLSASTGAAGEAAAFNLPYGDYTFAADDPGNVRHFSSPACSVPTCTVASIAFAAATVDLGVTKTVDNASPSAGGAIVYTITATNNGTVAASGVSVSDVLPDGVVYGSDDSGGAYSGGTWAITNLANGAAVTLHITATVASTATGTITNTATITSSLPDTIPANDSASAAITVTPLPGINLCATTGSTTMPNGSAVTVWGYVSGDCTGSPTVTQPGGPVIAVNQGDTITVTLYNNLSANTALLFQGQNIIPDLVGAPPGGSKTYVFQATAPGTYLYEAGLLPNAQHQVAMGLYGALIVRPATAGQAYASAATAYDEEAVLVLSEIDPTLNNSANPAGFDLRNYKPRYFLINGKAYPQTAAINTSAGHNVLFRYINAGLQHHSMASLGLRQSMVAVDGSLLNHAIDLVADTLAPGQTADAIASVPAGATGSKFALYDGNLILRNNTSAGFGGMMTFVATSGTPPAGDMVGPTTSNVSLVGTALSATVSDVGSGGSNVTAAEYFIDTVGANGSGTAMTGAFGSPTVSVNATVSLSGGTHTIYVHGQDSAGNWGPVNSVGASLDQSGPATTGLTLTPNPTNGTAAVAISASADDTATGGSNIAAAEYTIDGGAAQAMTLNTTSAPAASLSATISAATVNALAEGSHVVSVRSQDSAGNWGTPATINLIVDKTGPTTSAVTAAPNPNNGTLGVNSSTPAVRVTATLSDVASNISTGEGFIDTVGATGTGFPFIATDGSFNSLSENVYADIPLTTIIQLSAGNHTIYVHGKDAAGNWGATSSTILVIDKTPPSIVSINRVDPNPSSAASVQFLVTFSEAVTGVTSSNFTLVQGGGLTGATITSVTGSGATRTVTASTGTGGGTLGLNLTSATGIRDVAGNALPTTGLPFVGQVYTLLTPPLYFSTAGNSNPPGVGGTADDADIYFWSGSAFSRVIDASTLSIPNNANVDGFDRVDATHFYMSFTGNVSIDPPGPNNTLSVADEDVVYYNNGTWSLFFDGSAHGLPNSMDLDAISIVGGTLYFSTDNTNVPPGVSGAGDDADIYRWNGGNSYTRVFDASALGWSTANVDGFVWVDATHFYMSYSTDTTVPGLGAVQDEDVVYYNAGTWSVYFDGTSKGLTSNNLDVDAFDLP